MKVQLALSLRSGPAAQTGLQFLLHQVYSVLMGQQKQEERNKVSIPQSHTDSIGDPNAFFLPSIIHCTSQKGYKY